MSIKSNKSLPVVCQVPRGGNRPSGGPGIPNENHGETEIHRDPREEAVRRCVADFPKVETLEQALTLGAMLALLEGEDYFTELFLSRLAKAKEWGLLDQSYPITKH